MAINLDTCFFVTRAAVPHMLRGRYGRIVNISSVSGPLVTYARGGAYGAAKSAMVGYTRSLALELGRKGITANAIAPGWVETGSPSALELRAGRNTPAGAAAGRGDRRRRLLSGERRASYVTGQLIVVDGGSIIPGDQGQLMSMKDDRVVLITGGAGGMGRAIAARFLEAGATVAASDLNPRISIPRSSAFQAMSPQGRRLRAHGARDRGEIRPARRAGRRRRHLDRGSRRPGDRGRMGQGDRRQPEGRLFHQPLCDPGAGEDRRHHRQHRLDAGLVGNAGASIYCASRAASCW